MFPSTDVLTSEMKATAIQFQYLKGSNRIAEFQKLYKAVLGNNTTANSILKTVDVQQIINYTFNDIEKILGPPDVVLPNGSWVYYLNANQENCKAVFGSDSKTKNIFCNTYICK